MKQSIRILLIFLALLFSVTTRAQENHFRNTFIHGLQKSNLFCEDILINDNPDQPQKYLVSCSAFNGWLYAISYFRDSIIQDYYMTLRRSKDQGVNWSTLWEGYSGAPNIVLKVRLIACGQDTNTLKLFAGYLLGDQAGNNPSLIVVRYTKDGGNATNFFSPEYSVVHDFDLAGDNLYPASGSNPFSIGVLYSMTGYVNKDSIIFCSSSNGGMSFDKRYRIVNTSKHFGKVSLSFGRSSTQGGGRYFATWEEKDAKNSPTGRLYTSHSEPNFNSQFTAPLRIDSIDPASANNVRNPVLCCQNSGVDNDAGNLTEVIMYEKFNPTNQTYNMAGLYNKSSTNSTSFQKFTIDATPDVKTQSSLSYNPYDSTFLVTFFNQTTNKLPIYSHDFNMNEPDNWNGITSGYNDEPVVDPWPIMITNFGTHTASTSWVGIRPEGKEAAYFDAPYLYYTGVQNQKQESCLLKIYPNPAKERIWVNFKLNGNKTISIEILNNMGQVVQILKMNDLTNNEMTTTMSLAALSSGSYFIRLKTEKDVLSKMLFVVK